MTRHLLVLGCLVFVLLVQPALGSRLSPDEEFARERILELSQRGSELSALADICSRWDCTDPRLTVEPESHRTPLFYAAITGAQEQLEFLLSVYFVRRAGGDQMAESVRRGRLARAVNAVETSSSATVLMWAMLSKNVDIVRMLLSAGADPFARDHNGWTALFYAAASDFAGGAALSVEFAGRRTATDPAQLDVDEQRRLVNAVDQHGRTALHVAVAERAAAAAASLLASQLVDYSLEDENMETAVTLAARLDGDGRLLADIVAALPYPSLPRHGPEHRTLLHTAAARGDSALLQLLVQRGYDVDPLDDSACTPLMLAAAFGRAQAVNDLLAAGASVRAVDSYGRTALAHAILSNNKPIADTLVAHGADLNQLASDAMSVLHHNNKNDIE